MTKWVSKSKFEMSTRYLSNEMARKLHFPEVAADNEGEGSWS